jgi:hypothetical protein
MCKYEFDRNLWAMCILALSICYPESASAQAIPEAAARAAQPPNSASPAVAAALDARLDMDFSDTPLIDVLDFLQTQTGVTFYIRRKSLEEAGVTPDLHIDSRFGAIRVETWLDLVLGELELTWYEKDGLIVITTPEDAEVTLFTRVYNCRDLLALPLHPAETPASKEAFARAAADRLKAAEAAKAAAEGCGSIDPRPLRPLDPAERLMEIISRAVDLHTWDEVGGPGTMGEYSGLLVVTQTDRTHKRVERVLDMLREAAGLEVPKTGKVVR